MSNYSLIANTQFRNRSFDDMLKPLLMYTQEYNTIEDAASDLATKASVWEGMANEQTDPEVYAQYKRYADDLQRQAVNLSQNGLNPTTRRELLNLKRRYSSEITPIEQAYANRKAQADEQRKALLQNPTLLLSRRTDMTSLDDYMKNPQLGYESYSGALLTQQVGQAASAIAKELRDYGKGKPLDGFTKTWLQQHGFTAAEVAQAINNPDSPRSSHILNTLVNNVMVDSGVPQWADRAILNQAYSYARQGLWNAVGETKVQTYTDEAAKLAAQETSQKRIARYAAGLQNPTMNITPKFDRRNVRTNREISDIMVDKNMLSKYRDYFYKTSSGSYALTKEGMKAYRDAMKSINVGVSSAGTPINSIPVGKADFKDWIDKRGLSEMAKGRTGKHQSSILQSMITRAANQYDTNAAGEYIGLIDSSQYENVIGALSRAAQEGTLKNYERKKKGNSYEFVPTNDVDVSKLTNTDIKSAVPVYGIHGNFLEVSLKDGARVTIPYNNLNTNYNSMVAGNVNDAYALELMKAKGMETFTYSDGRTVPIDVAITDALNQGYDNFMSGLGTSQVEPQKTTRGLYQMR